MQIFSRSPRAWRIKPVDRKDVELFRKERERAAIRPVVVHTSYLINLSSPDDELFKRSLALFRHELSSAELLGADYLVTHLGSHRGAGTAKAFERIKRALGEVTGAGLGTATMVLAENSAGGGNTFGSSLKEIGSVIEYARSIGLNMGLCFDTCHGFASGYDMRTAAEVRTLVGTIEREVGIERLRLIHLNDSKGAFNSGVDRHEAIGRGRIGRAGLGEFLMNKKISSLPVIMETPKKDKMDDLRNLKVVRAIMMGK